jgi:hypothetical protein
MRSHEHARRQHKRHRFPPKIIARGPVSAQPAPGREMLRGIVVSYETIRRCVKKLGPDYACRLRRKPPSRDGIWHMDEVVVSIAGGKVLAVARSRSGRICARRDHPEPPQHLRCQAIVNTTVEEVMRRRSR